jgi:hypothetical protein
MKTVARDRPCQRGRVASFPPGLRLRALAAGPRAATAGATIPAFPLRPRCLRSPGTGDSRYVTSRFSTRQYANAQCIMLDARHIGDSRMPAPVAPPAAHAGIAPALSAATRPMPCARSACRLSARAARVVAKYGIRGELKDDLAVHLIMADTLVRAACRHTARLPD